MTHKEAHMPNTHTRKLNLTGKRYGKLTVIAEAPTKTHGTNRVCWECLCDCGNTHTTTRANLQSGHTNSCGCINKENPPRRTHGNSTTRLYSCWADMHQRCSSTTNAKYKRNYIDRGITICAEWYDLDTFIKWAIYNGYHDSLSLDRIETLGNYTPDNCRWATLTTQSRNRRKLENTSSQYIGVSYVKAKNRFMATVFVNNKNAFCKKFKTELEAAQARDKYIIDNNLQGYRMNF